MSTHPPRPEEVEFTPAFEPDPRLTAEGWVQRYLADPRQAEEARQSYQELGFEVRFERLLPEAFGAGCGECRAVACSQYVMIYTRRPPPAAGTGSG